MEQVFSFTITVRCLLDEDDILISLTDPDENFLLLSLSSFKVHVEVVGVVCRGAGDVDGDGLHHN